jgi:hypothetical protein
LGRKGTENFSFRPIQGRKKIFHPIQGRKKNLPSHTRTENIFRLPSREYSWIVDDDYFKSSLSLLATSIMRAQKKNNMNERATALNCIRQMNDRSAEFRYNDP